MLPAKYKINRIDNENLAPEETLADNLSAHSPIEVPIGREVFGAFYAFVLLILVFFGS